MMTQSPYSPPRPVRPIGRIIVVALLLGLGVFWMVRGVRMGKLVDNPSGATMINSTRPADGARDVPVDTHISASLNAGHAIDPNSLDSTTVQLYTAEGQRPVAAQVSASATGEGIILAPTEPLEPSTRYIFVSNGVKDDQGAELMPFKVSFTTGSGQPSSH